jgi:hypothetical protein
VYQITRRKIRENRKLHYVFVAIAEADDEEDDAKIV